MSKQSYRVCFCCRRKFKLTTSEIPQDVKFMFESYSENGAMSAENLQRFLFQEQKESSATVEDAVSIIEGFKQHHVFHRGGLNLEGFFKFLFSDRNSPISPNPGAYQDMNFPLSHYFIYTGHNSYLTGNQLSSDCSDIPIIQALERGVRVIELDVWPNSTNDNVNVLHGRTLTTPVALIQCLESIRKHAFDVSDYPVVVTLEDHLTPALQALAAKMLTETFGDLLYLPDDECLRKLPSPESLKRRIIISTKPPKEYLEAKEMKDDSHKGKHLGDEEAWGKEVPNLKSRVSDTKEDEEDNEDDHDPDNVDTKGHQQAPEYRRLIAIHAGKPKGGLKEALAVDPNKVRRLSLSEQQLEKAAVHHGAELVRFTQQNMLRIYPKGTRITSSNYNPLIGWMHGAQMVAFNMQGYGRSLWLMQGMFRANGGCGYVKKPDFLLESGPNGEVFNPEDHLAVKKRLKVTVYMGDGWYYDFSHTHFDAYSPPDFYCRVGIAGVAADTIMKKTKTLEDNWIPAWQEEFEFPLSVPELALLRIEVHEYDMSEKDDFAGQTCFPVSEIREGIRAIPLHDRKGKQYKNVKLLVRFQFV